MEYHKINSLYKRDETGKRMLYGEFSCPAFEYLQGNRWLFTEKVDGTNIRIITGEGNVTFGGKTANAQIPTKLLTRLQERFLLPDGKARLLEKVPSGILYGEGYGAGIQSGGNYGKEQDFVLFDVRIDGWWLERDSVTDVAAALGVPIVPIVGDGTLHDLHSTVEKGFDSTWGPFKAEGIVARPAVSLFMRNGERIITKLKHKDFVR